MKILIIEDELLIQKSLKKIFESRGATVLTSGQGRMAIQLFKDHCFDKILCDLMLQDITGFDVIEEYKGLYGKEEVSAKFIIMTAYSSNEVLAKASAYGCTLLSKPFSNLSEVINLILSSSLPETMI